MSNIKRKKFCTLTRYILSMSVPSFPRYAVSVLSDTMEDAMKLTAIARGRVKPRKRRKRPLLDARRL